MNKYKVGHSYIDDIANSKDIDQFVKWLPCSRASPDACVSSQPIHTHKFNF